MKRMIFFGLLILFLAPISAVVLAQDKCEAPVWNVGDKWTYHDETGSTFTNEVVKIEEDLFIVKTTGDLNLYAYDKKTLNVNFLILQDGTKKEYTSSRKKLFDFPIFVGKKWRGTFTGIAAGGEISVTYIEDFKVQGIEEVTTPAGTFRAYKILYTQFNANTKSSGWIRYWYSPEVKTWVKRKYEKSSFWSRVRAGDVELISYELKK